MHLQVELKRNKVSLVQVCLTGYVDKNWNFYTFILKT